MRVLPGQMQSSPGLLLTVGSLVVLLRAIDMDSGINAAVAYSIQSVVSLQLSPPFAINSTSGEMHVANQKLIDRETTSHIVLSVLAFNPYFLLDDNATASEDAFTINPASGMISVAHLLDRETTAEHLLTVMASDGTFPTTAEVLISLTDVNDNVPILSPLSICLELPEDTLVGSVVFSFNLTEADAGNNSVSLT